jgi:two-component system, chemotaxis family, sensor kinase CheA
MIDDDLISEFLVESFENLDRLDQDFVDLEREPESREILASIFRTVHTIKGTCGFLGYHKLESVTHVGENLLGKLRDGKLTVNEGMTSTLLRMVDAVREMLAAIEASGSEGDGVYDDLIAALTLLLEGGVAPATAEPDPHEGVELAEEEVIEMITGRLGGLLVSKGLCTVESVTSALKAQMAGDDRRLGDILIARGNLSVNQLLEVLGEQQTKHEAEVEKVVRKVAEVAASAEAVPGGITAAGGRSVADTSIRVDVTLLDNLIDLVGELVLARNQLVQVLGVRGTSKGNPGAAASARVSQLTSELQERVMKTRMQPINSVWGKLPRVVRDLALQCGKQVRVEMEGQDTELDRTIIEAIKDPLTHLVRNSVDHGIEGPAVRKERGKPAEGRLFLRAFHEGGKVVIEISDDGGGIDPEKIKEKALEKGVITPEQYDTMADTEAVALIFHAGFSTAEKVSNISGRGVGMDVVKTNIERIGGTLDVQSSVGLGTTLVIRIPLTLAIVPALIVQCRDARFAVPQPNLVELVRLRGDNSLERVEGAAFYRLRGELLPVIDLAELLEMEEPAHTTGRKSKARTLAVLQVDGRQFGLLVDRVNDAEEIVVKPLGRHLKNVPLFAGCTIMGDGSVALILDVMAMAQQAHISATKHRFEASAHTAAEDEASEHLLLCVAGGVRLAVPLSKVSRLEHIKAEAVELAGNQEVVKYGSSMLPIVRVSQFVGGYSDGQAAKLKAVVTSTADGRTVGMVVDQILDSVAVPVASLTLQGTQRYGVLGTAVVRDQVVDVVDVDACIDTVDHSFFHPAGLEPSNLVAAGA